MFFLILIFLITEFNIIFQALTFFNLFRLFSNLILLSNYYIFIIPLLNIYLSLFNFVIVLPF